MVRHKSSNISGIHAGRKSRARTHSQTIAPVHENGPYPKGRKMTGSERIDWKPEHDEALELLLGDENNLSFKFIAERLTKQFGLPFSKNGCIGRSHRLKLPPRPPRAVVGRWRQRKSSKVVQFPNRIDAPILPKEARKHGDGYLTILQLGYGDCKYPFGDRPPYLYCGRPTRDGASFCSECRKTCYVEARHR